jgi:UDP-2,3-diacylglucosamine hydrolase
MLDKILQNHYSNFMNTTKYTVFISDTHFNDAHPGIAQRFVDFLKLNTLSIETLYLLGDLFDVWVGDDDTSPVIEQISDALAECAASGVKIYFIHGNRDYLIGQKFAENCGMTILNDGMFILLNGKPTLLMHGDLLCTDDHAYQRYRNIMFSPWMKKICLMLPLAWRKKMAAQLRGVSQNSHTKKPQNIMDVSPETVIKVLENNHAQWLIHGHTHRPGHHEIKLTHQTAHRVVLGAWDDAQGNALITNATETPRLVTFQKAICLQNI